MARPHDQTCQYILNTQLSGSILHNLPLALSITLYTGLKSHFEVQVSVTASSWVSGIGAVVKVVDCSSLRMGFNSRQKLQFSHSLLKQRFITVLHVFWSVCYWNTTLNNTHTRRHVVIINGCPWHYVCVNCTCFVKPVLPLMYVFSWSKDSDCLTWSGGTTSDVVETWRG